MTAARIGRDGWVIGKEGDPNESLLFLLDDLNHRYPKKDLTTLHSVRRHVCENVRCPSPDMDLDREYPGLNALGHAVQVPLPGDARTHSVAGLLHDVWD